MTPADASDPEDDWQTVEIAPEIVIARALGLSYGFVVFDDTGTELECIGDDVNIRLFLIVSFTAKTRTLLALLLEVESEDVRKGNPRALRIFPAQTESLP